MLVIAIDLDGTALRFPEKVNQLYENPNNFIVIHTARSSKIRKGTVQNLKDHNIQYHALVMDKVRADIYIDDKNQGGLQWPEF